MQTISPSFDFSGLTTDERIDLAMALWDSVHEEIEKKPLLPLHREELERRMAAIEAGEMPFSSWDDVKKRVLAKIRK